MIRWAEAILGAGAAFVLAFLLHTVDVNRIDSNWREKLEAEKAVAAQSCADAKKLTEENSHAYQNEVDNLERKLAALKRLHATTCIPLSLASQASGGGSEGAGRIHAGQTGVAVEPLLEYGATCERLRLQVISLQDFINKVWDK